MEIDQLSEIVRASAFCGDLFDDIPDIVYFVKDREGRYRDVNQTLVERCGGTGKGELLGRTAREIFPPPLGDRYLAQDRTVLDTGRPVRRKLELHIYPGGVEGWCLTHKLPISGVDGEIWGLAGVSRDLHLPSETNPGFEELAQSIDHLQRHFGEALRIDQLARMAGLSEYQFNARVRAIFQITAKQLLTKTRIDAASELLRTGAPSIADIAVQCGYFDQSAFTRRFRDMVGMTPHQYRERHRVG